MSVLVLQVFHRGGIKWLWLAILAHATFDFVVPVLVPLLGLDTVGRYLRAEALVMVFGLWQVFRFRDQPAPSAAATGERAQLATDAPGRGAL